jgi:hypothetical protein
MTARLEAKTDDCLQRMETYLERKEPTPVEMAKVTGHPEDPNEEAEMETIGTLWDRNGERHLALRRHQQSKKRT